MEEFCKFTLLYIQKIIIAMSWLFNLMFFFVILHCRYPFINISLYSLKGFMIFKYFDSISENIRSDSFERVEHKIIYVIYSQIMQI